MAESTKHVPNLNIKSLFSIFKTRKATAFAYAFMLAFVSLTVFLAFFPSSNASSPWFNNIFTTKTSISGSYKSQLSNIFSFFFHNTTTSSSSPFSNTSYSPLSNTSSSPPFSNTSSSSPFSNTSRSSNSNTSQSSNKTTKTFKATPFGNKTQNPLNQSQDSVSTTNQTSHQVSDETKHQKKTNQTANEDVVLSNNQTALKVKDEIHMMESLMKCDFFDGKWVKDESYPLYEPGSCNLIDEQFNCINNGRADKDYQKYKWKPKGCTLPRLDGHKMLDLLRGKRVVFVGDSINRNMWESLICILRNSVKDKSKVFEANGRVHFKGESSYSFVFKDYNFSVELFVSPFLVQEWETPVKNGTKKETLRLDLVGRSSNQYKDADIIIFNTGHWWTHDKTSKGKDYYQEGSHIYNELNVLEAFRKAITTWSRWVDANINTSKSMVFFRGYSSSHFSGGQWNSGGQCDSEIVPIKNEKYLRQYPPKMRVLEKVLRNMKTHVTYLNVTKMTDFRKDGHPSIYRKLNLSPEERKSPLMYQDCSHWCLPGVPDTWNAILYAELLMKQYQNQNHH